MNDPITIYFELEQGADLESIRAQLAAGLASLPNVETSQVVQPEPRMTGVELVALLGAAIVIAKSAKDTVDALEGFVTSVTKLVRSIKGLKAAVVETPSGPKNIEEVDARDIKAAMGE